MTCAQLEIIRWGISIAIPAIFGLVGVIIGAWLSGRRDKKQRRLLFIEQQLKGFYSPMLGLRREIIMRSELRVKIHDAAGTVWQELCDQAKEIGEDTLGEVSRKRGPEFTKIIDYDNKQLQEELLPAYRQMAELFRNNLWLADPETQKYYQSLIEFIELWDRWLGNAIPAEVFNRLEHTEERLKPFYEHIQKKHDELREKIKKGEV